MPGSSPYSSPEVLARISRLGFRAQKLVEGTLSGLHRSPLHGVSVEFADYREYTPGDDLKRLDWRAYGRSNRYYIKQYEEESNLRATMLVDASASMRYGSGAMSKYEYAATLAASLATLLISQRDAVGMSLFDVDEKTFLRPSATKTQMSKIYDELESARPQPGAKPGEKEKPSNLGGVMQRIADQIKGRGVVMIFSDMLVDLKEFYDSLGRLQHRGHEILIFQILDDDEIQLPFNDSVIFRDIEGAEEIFAEPWAFRKAYAQAMETFITDVKDRCQFGGIDHVLMKTSDDLSHALSYYLHLRESMGGLKRGGRVSDPNRGKGGA